MLELLNARETLLISLAPDGLEFRASVKVAARPAKSGIVRRRNLTDDPFFKIIFSDFG